MHAFVCPIFTCVYENSNPPLFFAMSQRFLLTLMLLCSQLFTPCATNLIELALWQVGCELGCVSEWFLVCVCFSLSLSSFHSYSDCVIGCEIGSVFRIMDSNTFNNSMCALSSQFHKKLTHRTGEYEFVY